MQRPASAAGELRAGGGTAFAEAYRNRPLIAEVCRKFSGEARDELDKHLRRLVWIQENPVSLKGIVGFAPELEKMEDRIVTSNRVPLTYLTLLPIEPGKFVPLPELQP